MALSPGFRLVKGFSVSDMYLLRVPFFRLSFGNGFSVSDMYGKLNFQAVQSIFYSDGKRSISHWAALLDSYVAGGIVIPTVMIINVATSMIFIHTSTRNPPLRVVL